MEIKFNDFDCYIQIEEYINNRKAIVLREIETNDDVAVASVNLPNVNMDEDEIAIKTYSENVGMLSILVDAGVISPPIRYHQLKHVNIPICKLLIK